MNAHESDYIKGDGEDYPSDDEDEDDQPEPVCYKAEYSDDNHDYLY